MANCVEVAKKIRAGLKTEFPHTKFSVTSKRYSMGSSVYVSWTDFPTSSMVNEYIKQFEDVRRCPHSGEILSGGNLYISGQNDWTQQTRALIENRMKEQYSEEMLKDRYWDNRAFTECANAIYDEMHGNNSSDEQTKEEPAQIEIDSTVVASYILNNEHNGIEISFTGKPTAGTIVLLKENGFRWHNFKKVWYSKQSQERLFFADAICSTLNDIADTEEDQITEQPKEQKEVETVITEPAKQPGEKVKVKEIIFEWSESSEVSDGHIVSTFAEADEIIRQIASQAPDNGAYDKTAFKIVYEDGQTYKGRYDVQYKDRINGSLSAHVAGFVKHSAGIEKPTHMSQTDWENLTNGSKSDWLEFYNNYALEDVKTPDPEQEEKTSTINTISFHHDELTAAQVESINKRLRAWADPGSLETIPKRIYLHETGCAMIEVERFNKTYYIGVLLDGHLTGMTYTMPYTSQKLNDYQLLHDFTMTATNQETDIEPDTKQEPASNVIDFTQFKTTKTTNNSKDILTPEQEFKRMILVEMFGQENVDQGLDAFGNIDELFKIMAELAVTLKQTKSK